MRNKKIIIALSIMVFLSCLAFIIYQLLNSNDTVSIKSVRSTEKGDSKAVTILNRTAYDQVIDGSYDNEIKETLDTYLKLSLNPVPKNITGTIRENTYGVTATPYGDVTHFIVDFPKVKISYKVTYSEDTTGYRAVYVSCLDKNERIYPEIKCMDNVDE